MKPSAAATSRRLAGFGFRLERHERLIVATAVGFVLFVAIVAAFAYHKSADFGDEPQYLRISHYLVSDVRYSLDGIHPTAWRPPGFPVFLAAGRFVGLGTSGLRAVNIALLVGTVVLLWAFASMLWGRAAGALAAVVGAVYPLFIYTATTFYPQTLATFLLLLCLFLTARAARKTARGRSVAAAAGAGLVGGALAMTVNTFAFAPVLCAVWLLYERRGNGGTKLAAIVLCTAVLFPAIWVVRNFSQFDAFVPFSTISGITLLSNENPRANADGVSILMGWYVHPAPGMTEVQRDAFFRRAAIRWAEHHPVTAAWLYVRKLAHFFAPANTSYLTRGTGSFLQTAVGWITYVPLLLLVLLRLAFRRTWPLRNEEPWLLVVVVVDAVLQAVYLTRVRYRIPTDAILMIVASGWVAYLTRRAISSDDPLSTRRVASVGRPPD